MKAYEFKLQDSGYSVKIRKVSPLLAQKITESFPAPKPPMQKVKYGDDEVLEPNPSNPQYIEDLTKYQSELEHKIQKLIIERGVEIEITPEMQAEIDELKGYMKDELGVEILNESDKFFYVSYIMCSSANDLGALIEQIISKSQPTEEKVEKITESFPGKD